MTSWSETKMVKNARFFLLETNRIIAVSKLFYSLLWDPYIIPLRVRSWKHWKRTLRLLRDILVSDLSLIIALSQFDLLWKIHILLFPLGNNNGWQHSPEIMLSKNNIVQDIFNLTFKCFERDFFPIWEMHLSYRNLRRNLPIFVDYRGSSIPASGTIEVSL